MANKFWVGGTGDWSDSTNHWSLTSGGLPAPLLTPTSSDDVFIDSSSGFGSGGTITTNDGEGYCHDFTSNTGHTYTIHQNNGGLSIYGSSIFESGLTIEIDTSFYPTVEETITTNSCNFYGVSIYGPGTLTLQDDLTLTGHTFYQDNGTFDANDHNITTDRCEFYADTGYTPTVYMGSGTWETTGDDTAVWEIDENNGEVVIIYQETSTIKITGAGIVGLSFYGGDKTYNNIWLTVTAFIAGSNTFNDFKIDAGLNIIFDHPSTQTLSSFTATGTSGNEITLDTYDGTNQFTLSKSSGVVSCDYLNLSNSNATGGATWYAGSHSVDTTNNDGWIFGTVSPFPSFKQLPE